VESLIATFEAYGAYLWLFLLLLMLLAVVWLAVLHRRLGHMRRTYAALLTGADGQDLGALLSMYVEQMQLAASKAEQLSRSSDRMEIEIGKSMQRLGLVRFNAFEGLGGEQSFAIALLDGAGDGFVLSSLQGRDDSRLYAKPVSKWDSAYTLSVEEKQAIAQAYEGDVDKPS
jgi:hypothetical protein